MVSLSRSFNTNSGGVTFFSESVNMADRDQLFLVWVSSGDFQKISTVPLFRLYVLLVFIIQFLGINYRNSDQCQEYINVIYFHVALCVITFIMYLRTKFIHDKVLLNGYLQFHKIIEAKARLPVFVVSVWTVMIPFVQALMQHFYADNLCMNLSIVRPKYCLLGLPYLESIVLIVVNYNYILGVEKFNKEKPKPEVLNSEWLGAYHQNEVVCYTDLRGKVADVLEKQGNVILRLKERNGKFKGKAIKLSTDLQSRISENLHFV